MRLKIFLTSDLHFGHPGILKFEPITRPYKTIEEHDEAIIKRWNHFVRKYDIVYILGDLSMNLGRDALKNIITRLNGKKILVRGNHDKKSDAFYLDCGIELILEEAKIKLNKHITIKASHYPYDEPNAAYGRRFTNLRPKRENHWLCRGHTHSNGLKIDIVNRDINIGWDQWKKPVSHFEIIDIIEKSEEVPKGGNMLLNKYRLLIKNLYHNGWIKYDSKQEMVIWHYFILGKVTLNWIAGHANMTKFELLKTLFKLHIKFIKGLIKGDEYGA